MKYFDWNPEKNEKLQAERGISFEDIVTVIQEKGLLASIDHPNQKRYPNQRLMIVNFNNYAYVVPYVEDEKKYFLKTIIPSHKMTKMYIIKRSSK